MRRLEYNQPIGRAAEIPVIAGNRFVPHVSGALFWPDENALLIADLHLEKGASFARGRQFVPPYDTRETLNRLESALNRFRPRRVIALGDSFHTRDAADDLLAADRSQLASLQRRRDWLWVTGNHDPTLPRTIGGDIVSEVNLRGINLRHEPSVQRGPQIAGHLHPAARIAGRASIRTRCFAGDSFRLVMPAFGALAGGLNVLDTAFGALFARHALSIWACGRAGVYRISPTRLLPDWGAPVSLAI